MNHSVGVLGKAAALVLSAAASAPAAAHADLWWRFIDGCRPGQADLHGPLAGLNAEGQASCWSATPGGPTGVPLDWYQDLNVTLDNPQLRVEQIVPVFAPGRVVTPGWEPNSVTVGNRGATAVGVSLDRGSMVVGQSVTVGSRDTLLRGRFLVTGGSLAVRETLQLYGGRFDMTGGSADFWRGLVVAPTTVAALGVQTGGEMWSAGLTVAGGEQAPARWQQLGGTLHLRGGVTVDSSAGSPHSGELTLRGAGARLLAEGPTTLADFGRSRLVVEQGARFETTSIQTLGAEAELVFGDATVHAPQGVQLAAGTTVQSTGRADFSGADLSFAEGSRLRFDIAADGQHGALVGLDVLAWQAATLELNFAPGFGPAAVGGRLDLLDFASFAGSFDATRVRVTGWAGALDWAGFTSDGSVRFAAGTPPPPPIPEPGTWALFALGLAAIATAAHRRGQESLR